MPPVNYAVRLRASHTTLQTTIGDWARRSVKVLCYEHPEKDNIHCHFLLYGVYDSVDTLKRDMKNHGIELKGAGQLSFKTSFKLKDGTKVDINDETIPKYITYMSKGKYDPLYNKGYEQAFIDACKAAWVDKPVRTTAEQDNYTEFREYVKYKEKELNLEATGKDLKDWALYLSLKIYKVINIQCRRNVKMLLDTYCYDYRDFRDIRLPYEDGVIKHVHMIYNSQ